jgi:hypothetical protein
MRTAYSALANLAIRRTDSQGPASGLQAFDEAIAFAEAHGLATQRARALRTQVLFSAGRWDDLLAEAKDVSSWAQEHGDVPSAVIAEWMAIRVRLDRGESIASTEGIESMARDLGGPPTWVAPAVAEAAIARGDRDHAQRLLAEALEATPDGELWNPHCFVRACLRAGAAECARRSLLIGANTSTTAAEMQAAQAMVAELDGDLVSAHERYGQAAATCHSLRAVPDEADALAGLGRCLLGLGEMEEGIARLREARAIWERLRATPRIAEVDALLAAAPTA